MSPNSQVGLITVYANYEGNPNYLLGTAPIYDMVPGAEETARFSFIVPILDIPIAIPVTVRTGSDYGLRFTVSDITQLTPLASAHLTFWGIPCRMQATTPNASPRAPRANRPAVRVSPTPAVLQRRPGSSLPSTRSPTTRPPAPRSR